MPPTESLWATAVVAQSQRGGANHDRVGCKLLIYADWRTLGAVAVKDVTLVLIGGLFLCGGISIVVSPKRSLESNYAWDRLWTLLGSSTRNLVQ